MFCDKLRKSVCTALIVFTVEKKNCSCEKKWCDSLLMASYYTSESRHCPIIYDRGQQDT